MPTQSQVRTLISLKLNAGEDMSPLETNKYRLDMLRASDKEIKAEFERLNRILPSTEKMMLKLTELEFEIYGFSPSAEQLLSYHDADLAIKKLILIKENKRLNVDASSVDEAIKRKQAELEFLLALQELEKESEPVEVTA